MILDEILNENLRLIQGDIRVHPNITELDYSNRVITGYFDCSQRSIKTLKGSPYKVEGYYSCVSTDIQSLEGITRNIGAALYCYQTPMNNLHNIHRYIERVGKLIAIDHGIDHSILGILKIRDLKRVYANDSINNRLEAALEIINRHLINRDPNKRNIHICQEELLEAGLKEYAQL